MSEHRDASSHNANLRMPHRSRSWLRNVICLLAVVLGGAAFAAEQAPQQRLGDDFYTSAGEVAAPANVAGDAFAAGGRLALTGTVGGDAVVAGGSVNIEASVGQDLYAAGGEVRVANTVGGNARIAGGRVIVAPDAAIEGSATIAGGNVTLDGSVGGYVLISAGRTEINGRIDGDLRVAGGALSLGPEAVVRGRLDYRGAEPANLAPGAQVQGGIEQSTMDRNFGAAIGMLVVWLIGLILVAAALLAFAPRATRAVAQGLRMRPVASPLLGLALFVGMPIVGGLLMITMVGIPLGMLTISAWFTLSLLGYFATAIALGDAVSERRGPANRAKRIGAAAIAVLALFALGQIPYVGWMVWVLAILFGMGAVALAIWDGLRLRRRPMAATAA